MDVVREALARAREAAAGVEAAQRRLAQGSGRAKREVQATRADPAALHNAARFGRPAVDAIMGEKDMAHAARVAALAEARAALEARLRAVGMFRLEVGGLCPHSYMPRTLLQCPTAAMRAPYGLMRLVMPCIMVLSCTECIKWTGAGAADADGLRVPCSTCGWRGRAARRRATLTRPGERSRRRRCATWRCRTMRAPMAAASPMCARCRSRCVALSLHAQNLHHARCHGVIGTSPTRFCSAVADHSVCCCSMRASRACMGQLWSTLAALRWAFPD